MQMTDEQKADLCAKLDTEGFDYTFMAYSTFDEIRDPKFHTLRKAYIDAAKQLRAYIDYDDVLDG